MNSAILDLLKDCSIFKGVSKENLALLAPLFLEKRMGEGTTVFIENMPGESLYVIKEGTVQISKMIAEGAEKTLVILGPEDVFGELAILDGAPRSATARVAENAHLLSLTKKDFDKLCEQNPRLALQITRNIICLFSKRIRENNEDYREMLIWAMGQEN